MHSRSTCTDLHRGSAESDTGDVLPAPETSIIAENMQSHAATDHLRFGHQAVKQLSFQTTGNMVSSSWTANRQVQLMLTIVPQREAKLRCGCAAPSYSPRPKSQHQMK